jgi:hypothetical protein
VKHLKTACHAVRIYNIFIGVKVKQNNLRKSKAPSDLGSDSSVNVTLGRYLLSLSSSGIVRIITPYLAEAVPNLDTGKHATCWPGSATCKLCVLEHISFPCTSGGPICQMVITEVLPSLSWGEQLLS